MFYGQKLLNIVVSVWASMHLKKMLLLAGGCPIVLLENLDVDNGLLYTADGVVESLEEHSVIV